MISMDLHTHTSFSFDGHGTMDELCVGAIKNGINILASTEHYDLTKTGGDEYFEKHDTERIIAIKACAERYSEKLILLDGVELGQPHINPLVAEKLLKAHHFDMVMGSVHQLSDGRDVYDIDYKTKEQGSAIMRSFLEQMHLLASTADFDTLGHIDFPLRVMQNVIDEYTLKPYEAIVRDVLKVTANRGKALELNTRGFRGWQKCLCPELWVLKAFKDYGGQLITVGSDSHEAKYTGTGNKAAQALLQAAGFTEIVYYKDRKPVFVEVQNG